VGKLTTLVGQFYPLVR